MKIDLTEQEAGALVCICDRFHDIAKIFRPELGYDKMTVGKIAANKIRKAIIMQHFTPNELKTLAKGFPVKGNHAKRKS